MRHVFILFMLFWTAALALEDPARGVAVKCFAQAEGLPNSAVQSLVVDRQGLLWAGTQDGLACWNGGTFQAVPMSRHPSGQWVLAMEPCGNQGLWVGFHGRGLLKLDEGRWWEVPREQGPSSFSVFCLSSVRSSLINGELLVGTSHAGLWVLQQGRLRPLSCPFPNASVRCLIWDQEDTQKPILYAGTERGLFRLDASGWKQELGATEGSDRVTVLSLLFTGTGKDRSLWVGSSQGLTRFHRGQWDQPLKGRLVSVSALAQHQNAQGLPVLWVATDRGIFRQEGERWELFNRRSGLSNHHILSMLIMQQGRSQPLIWAGTYTGLSRLAPGRWKSLDTSSGLKGETVFAIGEYPKESYWFGLSSGGMKRFHLGKWHSIHEVGGQNLTPVVCFLRSRREGWLAGTRDQGLVQWVGNEWRWHKLNAWLPSLRVFSLMESSIERGQSTLWVGTSNGLIALKSKGMEIFGRENGLGNGVITALAEVEETPGLRTIWAGTRGTGVFRKGPAGWQALADLPSPMVNCLQAIRHRDGPIRLWVGTFSGGLAILDPVSPAKVWRSWNRESQPPLLSQNVIRIEQDAAGDVFLFTDNGVQRLREEKDGSWRSLSFGSEDGLPSPNCTQGSSYVDSSGRIWTGTGFGAASLDPKGLWENPSSLGPPLLRAQIDPCGQALMSGSQCKQGCRLRFDFFSLRYFRVEEGQYRLQLFGLDREASPWKSERSQEYPYLPAGNYEFRVWSRDEQGRESASARIHFRIQPSFWQSWWAWLIYASASIGAIFLAVILRSRSLHRRNEELQSRIDEATRDLQDREHRLEIQTQELAQANQTLRLVNAQKSQFFDIIAHGLVTPLNRIVQAAQLQDGEKDPEECSRLAWTIQEEGLRMGLKIRKLLDLASLEAGILAPEMEEFDLSVLSLQMFERFLGQGFQKGVQFRLEAPETPLLIRSDPKFLQNVLENLLSNALRHTPSGGEILLRIESSPSMVCLSVEDQGPGVNPVSCPRFFDPASKSLGLGLSITRTLVLALGGRIHVRPLLQGGACFQVDLPRTGSS